MDKNLTQREQLSALADGQLDDEAFEQAMQFAHEEEGRASWQLYHLVGDVLRSPELAHHADNGAFLQRLQQRLADEPVPGRPVQESLQAAVPLQVPVVSEAANASVFQWKMVAGLASVAAVAVVGWSSWSSLQSTSTGASMAALSSAPSAPVALPAAVPVLAQAGNAQAGNAPAEQIMLRDPRLDELLAAHQQFGSTSALQMPARFLRNATFEAPAR